MTINIGTGIHARWMQQEILAARAAGRMVSERNVLVVLSEAVLSGSPIDPLFQALANAVAAKAIVTGKLPGVKSGRPAGSKLDALKVASEYFDLIDGGARREDALAALGERYPAETRHLWRVVKDGSKWHGSSKAARDQAREQVKFREIDTPPAEGRVELACMDEDAAIRALDACIAQT